MQNTTHGSSFKKVGYVGAALTVLAISATKLGCDDTVRGPERSINKSTMPPRPDVVRDSSNLSSLASSPERVQIPALQSVTFKGSVTDPEGTAIMDFPFGLYLNSESALRGEEHSEEPIHTFVSDGSGIVTSEVTIEPGVYMLRTNDGGCRISYKGPEVDNEGNITIEEGVTTIDLEIVAINQIFEQQKETFERRRAALLSELEVNPNDKRALYVSKGGRELYIDIEGIDDPSYMGTVFLVAKDDPSIRLQVFRGFRDASWIALPPLIPGKTFILEVNGWKITSGGEITIQARGDGEEEFEIEAHVRVTRA
jgi:hypothetical protein